MTTTQPEKPVRRTQGRLPPPPEQTAQPLPPAPAPPPRRAPPTPAPVPAAQPTPQPARARGKGRNKKVGGIDVGEGQEAVEAYQRRQGGGGGGAPPSAPGAAPAAAAEPPDKDAGGEQRRLEYPWFERSQSRVIDYPDKRLIDLIKKPLENISQRLGVRAHQYFSDWLEVVEFTLEQMPDHLAHARKTGQSQPFAPGTPQDKIDRWMKIFARYGGKDEQAFVYQQFGEAFARLLEAAEAGMFDFVGQVYQELELTEKTYSAQYFTPMSVAFMMALMMQPAHAVYEHIYQALTHPDNVAGQALLVASMLFSLEPREGQEEEDKPVVEALTAGSEEFFFQKLLPAAMPYYEPVRISDPAIGSGVMIVATAAAMPAWMSEMGLVQFYGMDTDILCVRMAHINTMLYGLNGFAYRCWEAAQDEATLETLRDPAREAEWQAIQEKLRVEREVRREDEDQARAARAEVARANGAGLRVEVEEVEGRDGRKKQKKTLKSATGETQLELF